MFEISRATFALLSSDENWEKNFTFSSIAEGIFCFLILK
jgi:hypothetical protein